MNAETQELIKQLYEKADKDILTAEIIIEANPLLYDIAAFHCQQAAEKYLKSFLIAHQLQPPRTHNIEVLLNLCVSFNEQFKDLKFAETLTDYSVAVRYIDSFEIDSKEQALSILIIAKTVKDFVRNKIGI